MSFNEAEARASESHHWGLGEYVYLDPLNEAEARASESPIARQVSCLSVSRFNEAEARASESQTDAEGVTLYTLELQ